MQQHLQKAQSSVSMTSQTAVCHASHHFNSTPGYSCNAEGSAVAHQAELKHECQIDCSCQLQACPQEQQIARQGPEQPLWHDSSGKDQRQLLGRVRGPDMPLGLNVLQKLNQQHGMSSHSAHVDSEAASFPSSGSTTPERVAFVSQVKLVAFASDSDVSSSAIFLMHLASCLSSIFCELQSQLAWWPMDCFRLCSISTNHTLSPTFPIHSLPRALKYQQVKYDK